MWTVICGIVNGFLSLTCSVVAVVVTSCCRWITEIIPSCSWCCQGKNAANEPNPTGSSPQLFRLLLWDSQCTGLCMPASQAGHLVHIFSALKPVLTFWHPICCHSNFILAFADFYFPLLTINMHYCICSLHHVPKLELHEIDINFLNFLAWRWHRG